jgi:hypothetical protein
MAAKTLKHDYVGCTIGELEEETWYVTTAIVTVMFEYLRKHAMVLYMATKSTPTTQPPQI